MKIIKHHSNCLEIPAPLYLHYVLITFNGDVHFSRLISQMVEMHIFIRGFTGHGLSAAMGHYRLPI